MRGLVLFTCMFFVSCGGTEQVSFDSVEQACKKSDKVVICKVPPGNPAAAHTISVARPAVWAHLKTGSYLGPCRPVCGDGICNGEETCDSCAQDCGVCQPVDCVVSEWSAWSECSADCDGGTQSRSREIITQPAFGGSECLHLTEEQVCNTAPCDCAFSEWSAWSSCTAECGGGTQSRAREVTAQPVDVICEPLEEITCCNTQACPPVCGNSVCETGETCETCEVDCGQCEIIPPITPVCGDGICDEAENCVTCPLDCGDCCDDCCADCYIPDDPEEILYTVTGGAGCNASGTDPKLLVIGFALITLVILLGRYRHLCILFLVFSLVSVADAARPIPSENFRPAPSISDYYQTFSPITPGESSGSLRVLYDYAHVPLRLNGSNGTSMPIIDGRHTLNILGAVSLFDWLEVGVGLPVIVGMDAGITQPILTSPDDTVSNGVGDLRFSIKLRAWNNDWLHVGFVLPISAPTGNEFRLNGRGHFLFSPGAAVEAVFSHVTLAINTGIMASTADAVQATATQTLQPYTSWYGSVGGKLNVVQNHLDVVSDLFGSVSLNELAAGQSNLEWISGLRGRLWQGLYAEAGVGVGFVDGTGTPQLRGLFGLGWDFGWTSRIKTSIEPAQESTVEIVYTECAPCEIPQFPTIIENTIVVPSVYFDTDKDTVMAQSEAVLDAAAEIIIANPQITRVFVHGHADARASDEYNIDLSRRRAETVVRELVKRGVQEDLFLVHAHGERSPIAPNDSLHNMSKNRRVDLFVTTGE